MHQLRFLGALVEDATDLLEEIREEEALGFGMGAGAGGVAPTGGGFGGGGGGGGGVGYSTGLSNNSRQGEDANVPPTTADAIESVSSSGDTDSIEPGLVCTIVVQRVCFCPQACKHQVRPSVVNALSW